ncbi:unnamed protein product [Rodentolepis nana]|uniref:SH3 domain-containing protein n=1 Tax=Rodentolepis nana TaxID=102285 RepID=A0A0R3TAP0_RODNA|nr:unnamed protein product [Rodentolepis nana]
MGNSKSINTRKYLLFINTTPSIMAGPLHHPASRRQYIQRIPAYLPVEATKVSYSPIGSWRTGSVDSKSASISSGYGTPKACQMDSCCHHHSSASGFSSSEAAPIIYLKHSDSNKSSDTLVEDNFCTGKKRSYNAIKQKSGEICHIHSRENSVPSNRYYPDFNPPVPCRRHESGRQPVAENIRSLEKHQRSPQVYMRHAHQGDKHRHDFCPDHRRHQNVSRHSMYLASDSNESWKDSKDDYWPIGLNYPPSHTKLGNWKSEINLFDPQRFKVDVSTLDEEATQIYNEILDVAGSLAYEDQKIKDAEKRLSGVNQDQRKLQQRYKSFNPQNGSFEKAASRPFPRPLDSSLYYVFRRRSRRSDYERTPTNAPSPWVLNGHQIKHAQETGIYTPDSDTESALAALDNAVNFDFQFPSATNERKKSISSGPIPIIREYIGETEDDWWKLQARNFNGKESPTTYSVIEIDESSEEEEENRRRVVALPLDEVEKNLLTPIHALHIGSLNQNSGSFSELTPIDDLSYMSDVDI